MDKDIAWRTANIPFSFFSLFLEKDKKTKKKKGTNTVDKFRKKGKEDRYLVQRMLTKDYCPFPLLARLHK
jgi:hypothetical protein